jgi:hypothetical protein
MGEKNDRRINISLSIVDRKINSIYEKYLLRRHDSNTVDESVWRGIAAWNFPRLARTNWLEIRASVLSARTYASRSVSIAWEVRSTRCKTSVSEFYDGRRC